MEEKTRMDQDHVESAESLKEHITTQRVEDLTESCAREIQKGRIRRKVSQLGKDCTGSVDYLSGSRRATCQCWGLLGRRPILRRKSILGADLFLEKDLF
jgi:hypothetical protein